MGNQMAELPDKVGRYPIVGLLATGGMAEIMLGKVFGPSGFERPVVIKRVLSHLARQQRFVDMFLDEARIVAGIHHPNVVHVQELGREEDDLFLVMEYLDGESAGVLLRRLRKLRKRLPYGLAAHIVAEACAGLHAAHELTGRSGQPLGLVHRDLSPQNLFVTYSGQVKLIDFGVAHAADRLARTETGEVKGKFAYMSPEQALARPLDRRSDLFSLGIVLFELSTGRRLFSRPNELLTMQAICQDPLPHPSSVRRDYPPDLEALLMKALARRREDRFATAAEMRRALFRVMNELKIDESPTDALATVMGALFADRMAEKAEMLRRVRDGAEVEQVPSAEVDLDVDLPGASGGDRSQPSESARQPSSFDDSLIGGYRPMTAAEPPPLPGARRRRWLLPALGAGALLAAGGAGVVLLEGTAERATTTAAPTNTTASPSQIGAATAARDAGAAESSKMVTLAIESTPRGATVYLAGRKQGATPLQLDWPRGSKRVELVLERTGYQRHVEHLVPDADARLQLLLQPLRRVPAPTPATAKTSTRSFRRFD